jgi:hypothetical protein
MRFRLANTSKKYFCGLTEQRFRFDFRLAFAFKKNTFN